jgi:dTDP-glucose pyrophosphorylase
VADNSPLTERLASFLMSPAHTVREAMLQMNVNEQGIVLVVDSDGRLLDTVTDGDLRRAILSGVDLEATLASLAERREGSFYPEPVTVSETMPHVKIMELMTAQKLRHIPVIDDEHKVVDLVVAGEDVLSEGAGLPVSAMVMAGGFGKRLSPLTDTIPKPMLPMGDKPIMEHTIDQLSAVGIKHVVVSTHYLAEAIEGHFGDGGRFGLSMDYVKEEQPLGTAGALGLMKPPTEPLLVVNGDVLTQVNYWAMLRFHQENGAHITVGVGQYEFQVPYGVVEMDGVEIQRIVEKPTIRHFINAGVYLMEPAVLRHIPGGERFDMTDLIQAAKDAREKVVSFPISEYWRDVGHHGDYAQAQKDLDEKG